MAGICRRSSYRRPVAVWDQFLRTTVEGVSGYNPPGAPAHR
ncbi:hypothetical protein [Streptosporangium vulgare]